MLEWKAFMYLYGWIRPVALAHFTQIKTAK
jgi:hypothetical protein